MYPYYIFKINKFNTNRTSYCTSYQLGIDNVKDDAPKTSFKKREYQVLDGFIKYDLYCEIEKVAKGRAYGVDEIFEKFILIKENVFYMSKVNNILIIASNKQVFEKFFKDLENNNEYSLSKVNIDFNNIVKNIKSLGVQSVWLGKIQDDVNVKTLSMFGVNLEDSTKYNQLLKSGAEIKNLSLLYNFNGKQERIMITKDGGIILYNEMNESDALLLVEDVYKNMILPNS